MNRYVLLYSCVEYLFVDKITNEISGYTNSMATIRYNCGLIDPNLLKQVSEILDEDGQLAIGTPAGKFICLIQIDINVGEFTMILYDFKNDDRMLYRSLELMKEQHTDIRQMIIQTFNHIRDHYDEWRFRFEMKEGSPPNPETEK